MSGMPSRRRKIGSSPNGPSGLATRTVCRLYTLTTAGVTRLSMGASEGSACPSTAVGRAAAAGTAAAAAGAALAGFCSRSFRPVAANPPNAAAADRAIRVGNGRSAFFMVGRQLVASEGAGARGVPRNLNESAHGPLNRQ